MNSLKSFRKSRFWRRFSRHKLALIGIVFLAILISMAIFAPFLAQHNPNTIDLSAYRNPPNRDHWLGTDTLGRDILSRTLFGSRISFIVGLGAVAVFVIIGTVLGAIAGYYGGWIDELIMRLTDTFLSFPLYIIILVAITIIGQSIFNIIFAIGLLGWMGTCRIVRGQFLSLREREFVAAAKATGEYNRAIIFRYIVPNTIGPIIVDATFGVASAILGEAGLSFLGLGIKPPTPSLGNMITDAQSLVILKDMPWLWIPPGVIILLTVLSINFVGDGLRDALDVRSQVE